MHTNNNSVLYTNYFNILSIGISHYYNVIEFTVHLNKIAIKFLEFRKQ